MGTGEGKRRRRPTFSNISALIINNNFLTINIHMSIIWTQKYSLIVGQPGAG